jgi:hypothetical protein
VVHTPTTNEANMILTRITSYSYNHGKIGAFSMVEPLIN